MDLGELNRDDGRPPYRQIADALRASIDAGELRTGDRLPSEAELTAHYGVARMTARQAIAELRAEGRAVSEQGRGTFVLEPVRWDGRRPAYVQLAEELRGRIAAGQLEPGAKLPSYAELMDAFGVSVTVARAAVAALRSEGLVSTHQGKGAFVRRAPDAAEPSVRELLARVERLEARVAELEGH